MSNGEEGEDVLLRRESELRKATLERRNLLLNKDARRHFNEGFVRRHYMIQSSRLFLRNLTKPERRKPLTPYEATDCAIHVNAYYLNLRGALDNLAWVLQYEWQLLPNVTEESPSGRRDCNLLNSAFVAQIRPRRPELASVIKQFSSWVCELAKMRDPAAHRIPIYVPPAVFTSEAQIEDFRRIEAEADILDFQKGDRCISDIYQKARAVADFQPVMITSTTQGLEVRPIHAQIGHDHNVYLTVANKVVSSL